MRKCMHAILACVLLVGTAFAIEQEIPKLEGVTIKGVVDFRDGIYTYTYIISNGINSTGHIWYWSLDVKQPEGGVRLSSDELVNGPGYSTATSQLNLNDPAVPSMVSVGLFSPPNWGSGLTAQGQASWGSHDKEFSIFAGQSLSGFALTSHGLPGLRKFRIDPKFLLQVDEAMIKTEEDIEKALEHQSKIESQIAVRGTTVGPTAPPANFVTLDFLSYLIDLKHQAQTLGWIGGPKFVAELDKKLDQVKEKLQANNIPSARGKLKSFINKVEAQFKETKVHEVEKVKAPEKGKKGEEKKFITSEGYGLLKFNAMYLRDQLGPGEKPEEGKDAEKDD